MYKRSLRGWTPWGYSLIRGPIGTQGSTRSCSRGHPSVVEYFLQRDTWRRTSLQAALNQVPAISWHSRSKCDIGITGKERILVVSNIFDMGQNWNFIFSIVKKHLNSFLTIFVHLFQKGYLHTPYHTRECPNSIQLPLDHSTDGSVPTQVVHILAYL